MIGTMEIHHDIASGKDFKPWVEVQLQLLASATTREELLSGLTEASRLLGFDNFSFGIRSSLPVSSPKIEFVANYSQRYQQIYETENYLEVDPTVLHAMTSTSPFVWHEKMFASARPLWEESIAAGLSHGWAQSSRIRSGVAGMLSLSRSDEPLTKSELGHITPRLVWFNQLSQIGLHEVLLKEVVNVAHIQLTDRESEIMRWTADGKTAADISIILSVAERTVNFHISNVLEKFNVSNKIAASVQAVLLGII